jgi:hypothetical protein
MERGKAAEGFGLVAGWRRGGDLDGRGHARTVVYDIRILFDVG